MIVTYFHEHYIGYYKLLYPAESINFVPTRFIRYNLLLIVLNSFHRYKRLKLEYNKLNKILKMYNFNNLILKI